MERKKEQYNMNPTLPFHSYNHYHTSQMNSKELGVYLNTEMYVQMPT